MWDESLQRAFAQLEDQQNAHARGAHFEALVQRLFERRRFTVRRNAGAARPRQTDLFATYNNEAYLIETKWQRAPVDIDAIDSLWSRLERTSREVIGVFFSMSGFTKTAVDQVVHHRDRIILLVADDEIRSLFAGRIHLKTLLQRKLESLRTDGRVLLNVDSRSWRNIPLDRSDLAAPQVQFFNLAQTKLPWITSAGEFGHTVFAEELPDINWTPAQGVGVGLDFVPPTQEREDLGYVFDILQSIGWVSSAGRWSIDQAHVCWYGMGAKNFLDALDMWETRYQSVDDHLHHSERATYFDVYDEGFYTLSVNIRASHEGYLSYPHLSAQLVGIPLDTEPFRRLARSFDLDDQLYFRPLTAEAKIQRVELPDKHVRLEPVAYICQAGEVNSEENERWVTGIVVKNPCYGTREQKTQSPERMYRPDALNTSEVLVCDLSSWHMLGSQIDHYYLRFLEVVEMYGATVLYPVADWKQVGEDDEVINLVFGVPRIDEDEDDDALFGDVDKVDLLNEKDEDDTAQL